MQIENCLKQRDSIDMQIIKGILAGQSYEGLAEILYLSISTVRYRAHNIYLDANTNNKTAFMELLNRYLICSSL